MEPPTRNKGVKRAPTPKPSPVGGLASARPLRKYERELHELGLVIVNAIDALADSGDDRAAVAASYIWNALFGYNATIPVDVRDREATASAALISEARELLDRCGDVFVSWWWVSGMSKETAPLLAKLRSLLARLPVVAGTPTMKENP